jgi:general stress protein 26
MKKLLFFIFVFYFANATSAQKVKNSSHSAVILLKAAEEIMNSTRTCALITQDKNGISRVRTMDPFAPEKDFTVWFGTNPKSRKIAQIKNNNKVTIFYRDKDDSGYVMIYGKAELINDQKLKNKFWKDTWKSFYPNKKESYLLLKVTPIHMEIVSPPRNIVGSADTWEPPTLLFKKQ